MSEYAAMEDSSSKMENANGSGAANQFNGTMKWTELLKPENGGPGEPLGRLEAVRRAEERTRLKRARQGKKGRGR